jgi:hypothetical protein
VSRNIIHISTEMRKRDFAGAYWFSMYTTFFAVVSVLYFVLENPTNPTSFELLRDAVEGKEVLAFFAKQSMAADWCSTALNVRRLISVLLVISSLTCSQNMFDGMPESIRHGRDIIESKKRRHRSSPESEASRPVQLKQDDFTAPRRASTFPESMPNTKRTALPVSQAHLASLGLAPAYQSSSPSTPDVLEGLPCLTPSSSTASLSGYGTAATHTAYQQPNLPATSSSGPFPGPLTLNVLDTPTTMFPAADPLAYPIQPIDTFDGGVFHMFDNSRLSQSLPAVMQHMPATDTKLYTAEFGPQELPAEDFRRRNNDAHSFDAVPMQFMHSVYAQHGYQPRTASPSIHLPERTLPFEPLLTHEEWVKTFLDPNIDLNNGRLPFEQQHHGKSDWH